MEKERRPSGGSIVSVVTYLEELVNWGMEKETKHEAKQKD